MASQDVTVNKCSVDQLQSLSLMRLGIEIGDLDSALRLGIRIGDWDC